LKIKELIVAELDTLQSNYDEPIRVFKTDVTDCGVGLYFACSMKMKHRNVRNLSSSALSDIVLDGNDCDGVWRIDVKKDGFLDDEEYYVVFNLLVFFCERQKEEERKTTTVPATPRRNGPITFGKYR